MKQLSLAAGPARAASVCEEVKMLKLEKVNGKNVWDILKLCVSEEQKHFVAGNDISIIEAYTAITGNGYAFPFGIYEDHTPIGFLMIGFDTDDYWEDAPVYRSFGFVETGETDGEELIAVLKL